VKESSAPRSIHFVYEMSARWRPFL